LIMAWWTELTVIVSLYKARAMSRRAQPTIHSHRSTSLDLRHSRGQQLGRDWELGYDISGRWMDQLVALETIIQMEITTSNYAWMQKSEAFYMSTLDTSRSSTIIMP
jgi:hypothetical protein